jgi:fibronectin type 3 domain-containing protein
VAWYNSNAENSTHSVGLKKANELGLYDMSGNVWEICWDWFGNYLSESQINPKGPSSGEMRVLRGGSFYPGNGAYDCRIARRSYIYGSNTADILVGFRLAKAINILPPILSAKSLDQQIVIKWNNSTDTNIRSYRIYIGITSPATSLIDSTTQPLDTSKTITGLINGQIYYFRVTAVDSNGQESAFSNEVQIAPTIVSNGLVAYYPFNSNANDGTTNANNGANNNAETTVDRFGNINNAFSYSGSTSSYFQSANTATLSLQDSVTISAWIKASGTYNEILFLYGAYDSGIEFQIALDGTVTSNYSINGGWEAMTSSKVINDNKWHFVLVSKHGTVGTIYVDNEVVSSKTGGIFTMSTPGVIYGAKHPNADIPYIGSLDDIRIYNRTLNATEVDSLYREGGYNAIPQIPVISGSAGNQAINLKWNKIVDTDIRTYRIYQGTTSPAATLIDATTQPLDTSKTISGLINGQIYYFRVTAVDSSELESAFSNEVQIAPTIVSSGLVAYYPFNGNANDGSGNELNGNINGVTPTVSRTYSPNSAYEFNGSGNNIAVENMTVDQTQISISLWFMSNNFSNVVRILEHNWDGVNGVFTAALNTSGMLVTQIRTQNNTYPDVTTGPLQSGVWYHMNLSYDGINLSLYLNGNLVGQTLVNSPLANATSTLFIGSLNPYSFNGKIDDVRIYHRALTTSEIDSLYREGGYNAPPAIPHNLSAIPSNGQVQLRWNSITDTDLRAYKISYGTTSGAVTFSDSTAQRHDTVKTITGLTNGTTYYFRVIAIDSANQSSATSNEAIVSPYQLFTGEYSADTNTVLLMHFSETEGQFVQDVSGNINHGTAVGTTVVDGRFGKARNLIRNNATTGDYLKVLSSQSLSVTNSITMELWIKPTVNTGQPLLEYNDGSQLGPHLWQFNNGDQLYANLVGIDGGRQFTSPLNVINVNTWNHVALIYNYQSGQGIFYVNGNQVKDTLLGSFQLKSVMDLYIGARITNGDPITRFNGLIDELRVSKIARDPSEFGLQLPPKNLTASASGSTINLIWGNGGGAAPLMKYYIYRGTDSTNQILIDSTTQTTYTNTDLTSGIKVYYRVSAVDSTAFEGEKSYAASATPYIPPSPPTVVTLYDPVDESTNIAATQRFVWSRPSGAERFIIEVGTDPAFVAGVLLKDTMRVDTFYNFIGLPTNDTVYWRIHAVNSAGTSPTSPIWSFTTRVATPVPILTVLDTQRIKIKWNSIDGALGYNLYSSTNGITFSSPQFIAAGTDSITYSSLTSGARYYYKMIALSQLGLPSDTSSTVNGYTRPSVPINLQMVEKTDDKIIISWSKGAGTIINYRLYRSFNNGPFGLLTPTTATSYTDSGLVAGTLYNYRIRSVNGAGVESDTTAQIAITTYRQLPRILTLSPLRTVLSGDIPILYTAEVFGDDSVYFLLYYSLDGGSTFTLSQNTSGKDSLILATTNDTIIWQSKKEIPNIDNPDVRVKLVPFGVEGGIDAYPYSATTVLFTVDNKMPHFAGINSILSDSASLNVSWLAGNDNSQPLQYHIYKSSSSTINFDQIEKTVNGTSTTLTGLENFKQYYLAVRAFDSLGNSDTNTVVLSGIPAAYSRISTITESQTAVSHTFPIIYTASVAVDDSVSIVALYSVNGGATFDTIRTLQKSAPVRTLTGADTIIWNSHVDYNNQETNSARIRIIPIGRGGVGQQYTTASFTLDNKAPEYSGIISAIGDTNRVTLVWNAAVDISTPVQYRVYKRGDGEEYDLNTPLAVVNGTSYTAAGLDNFRTYYFKLEAVDSLGNSNSSIAEVSEMPTMKASIASIVTPSATQHGAIRIPYTISVGSQDTVGLVVLYSIDNGVNYDTARSVSGAVSVLTVSKSDTATWNSAAEYFGETATMRVKVIPIGKGGAGTFVSSGSFAVDNKYPQFAGVISSVGDTNLVALNWLPASDQTAPVTYRIFKRTDTTSFNFNQPDTILSNTTVIIRNLDNFHRYHFVVRASDGVGNIDTNTVTTSATPTILATILNMNVPGLATKGTFDIPYNLFVGKQDTVDIVTLYTSNNWTSADTATNISGTVNGIVHSKVDTIRWESDKEYKAESNALQVRLVPVGKGGMGNSQTSSLFTLDNRFPVFAGVQAAIGDTNKVILRWNKASDISSPIRYRIYSNRTGTFDITAPDTTVTDTVFTVRNLLNFKEYSFIVRAVDNLDNVDTNLIQIHAIPTVLANVVSIVAPSAPTTGLVRIPYTLTVGTQDTVRLITLFTTNDWSTIDTAKNVTGPLTQIIGSRSDTINWNSILDYMLESSTMKFRIVPIGKGGTGILRTTESFTLDNKVPVFAGAQSISGDTNKISLTWNAASDLSQPVIYRIVAATDPNLSNPLVDTTTSNVTMTLRGLKNFEKHYVKVEAIDPLGNRNISDSIRSATPTGKSTVISVTTPVVTQRGVVKLPYLLQNVPQDSVAISLEVSINGGSAWFVPKGILNSPAGITEVLVSDTVIWNSAADSAIIAINNIEDTEHLIENRRRKDRTVQSMIPEAIESDSVLVRLIPNGKGGIGTEKISTRFTVDNRAPRFSGVQQLASDSLGTTVTVRWNKGIDLSAPVKYFLYKSVAPASINYESPMDSVETDTIMVVHNTTPFVQYSFALRSKDSVGNIDLNSAVLSVTPSRLMQVTNIEPPVTLARTNLPVRFTLDGAKEDTATVTFQYSLDTGATWHAMNALTGKTANLTTFGIPLTVIWNCIADAPNIESDSMMVRIQVSGKAGVGISAQSSLFRIDTKAPQFSGLKMSTYRTDTIGAALLRWDKANDKTEPLKYFIYQADSTVGINYSSPVDSTADTSYVASYLLFNKSYLFAIRAADSVSNIDTNIFVRTLRVPVLGDLAGNDRKINAADLLKFTTAWNNRDTLLGDIGPADGTIPHLQPIRDHAIDFEDLMVISQMYNWTLDGSPGALLAKRTGSVPNVSVRFKESPVIKQNESKSFTVMVDSLEDLKAFDLYMQFDPAAVTIDSVTAGSSEGIMVLTNVNKEKGLLAFSAASWSKNVPDVLYMQRGLQIHLTALKKLEQQPMTVVFTAYDGKSDIMAEGRSSVEFNWRPVVPEYFDISQNYPNPFNPVTKIDYQLPVDTKVELKVYNMLGQEVTALVNEEQKAGYYSISWDASHVASGVYIYRLLSNENTKTKKMILIK